MSKPTLEQAAQEATEMLSGLDVDVQTKRRSSDAAENIGIERKRIEAELKQIEAIHKSDVLPELWSFVEEHRKKLRHDLNRLCNKYL